MANEFKGQTAHSAEWFGDLRDHWWHDDFIAHLASRWKVERIQNVLDVGCGVGHWGRLLARVLPKDIRIVGIDREPQWIEKARERAATAGLEDRSTYQVASAEALPFETDSFDLVSCQTLLMHVPEPERVLAEMKRVTKPGGLVVAAEATNLVGLLLDSIALDDPPDLAASLFRFQLVCQRGKLALGEGSDLLGESLPALFAAAALSNVELRLNDRALSLVPPYASASERALVEEMIDLADRQIGIWSRADTHRFFIAGGGGEGEFETLWAAATEQRARVAAAIRAKRYTSAGGGLFYVAWGWKR